MLRLEILLDASPGPAARTLTLSYAQRCRSRLRVRLDDGTDAGLFLPRGTVLRGGDGLRAHDGSVVQVMAAPEPLFEVRATAGSTDPHFDLRRAAYHLGNRHVPVHLLPDALRLDRDAVLRDMLRMLGLDVTDVVAPFEPESGAYGGGHRHDHDHAPDAGMLGELLSRQAHGEAVPELSQALFEPETR